MTLRIVGGSDFRDKQRRVNDEQALEDMRRPGKILSQSERTAIAAEYHGAIREADETPIWRTLAIAFGCAAVVSTTLLLWLVSEVWR